MRAVKHMVTTAKAPDKTGSFDGAIFYNPPEGDADGERVANFTNTPTTVPLDFQHLIVMDPGSVIGQIKALEVGDGRTLAVHGDLSISSKAEKATSQSKMADAVHERMLLDDTDPMVLKELSVAYAYDPDLVTIDPNGVKAIHDAELLAISVVHAGAQPTRVMNVKSELDVLEKTALAGLISVEQAMQYAEDLGIPGDISQKLFESSATIEKSKETQVAETGTEKVNVVPEITEVIVNGETMSVDEARKALGLPDKEEEEKALAGKPWHVEEQNGKYCVIKNSDGSEAGCHDTRQEAVDQIRALYANEKAVETSYNFFTSDPEAFINTTKNYTWTTTSNSVGTGTNSTIYGNFTISNDPKAVEEKAGRVIGAKRVTDLKAAIAAAIDDFASSVNGDLADKAEEVADLIEGDVADINAKLDELVADQTEKAQAEQAAATLAKVEKEVEKKVVEEAEEEIADFRLRLDALIES